MLQQFSCGHQQTCGFWKDDFIFYTKGDCPKCKKAKATNTKYIRPSARVVVKGSRVMYIQKARVVER